MKRSGTMSILLTTVAAVCLAGCVLAPPGPRPYRPPPRPSAPGPDAPRAGDSLRELLHLVNQVRGRAGAPPVRPSADLMWSAGVRACELPRRFSHIRPDGRPFDTALRRRGAYRAENIAAGSSTPREVMNLWMSSPGHRRNMLDPRHREVGLGRCAAPDDEFGLYWVQLFRR